MLKVVSAYPPVVLKTHPLVGHAPWETHVRIVNRKVRGGTRKNIKNIIYV